MNTNQLIPLDRIRPSKTNPRKHFDNAKLGDLTASVKAHGILQALLVRSLDGLGGERDEYELVCGERRYRAAKAAGLKEVPCSVRALTDEAVLEIQVIENLQRDDLHPLEEAEGYERLVKTHKHTPADIAAKVGKDSSYVNKRMKLLALCPKAREAFYADKLTPSIALKLARLADEKQQLKALQFALEENYEGFLPSAGEVEHWIKSTFMLALKGVPWELSDATLVPKAGPCTTCPKRTHNNPELFDDMKGDDRCLDGACFKSKQNAVWARLKAEAKRGGQDVLEGNAASQAEYSGKFVKLDDKCYDDPKKRTWKQLLGAAVKAGQVKSTILRDRDGGVVQMVPKSAALKAAGFDKLTKANENIKKQRQAAKRSAEIHEAAEDAIAAAIVSKVEHRVAKKDFTTQEWWLLALYVIDQVGHHPCTEAARRRGLKEQGERPCDSLIAWAKEQPAAPLAGLVFELLNISNCSRDEELEDVLNVDLDALEDKVRAEMEKQDAAAKAAPAKATPETKGKAKVAPEPPPNRYVCRECDTEYGDENLTNGIACPDCGCRQFTLAGEEKAAAQGISVGKLDKKAVGKGDAKPGFNLEKLSVPMPKGFKVEIQLSQLAEGWAAGCDVSRPKHSGGVGVPLEIRGQDRKTALASITAWALRILTDDMSVPNAVLEVVKAWAAKLGISKADLVKAETKVVRDSAQST